jgi:hypothetical protein
MYSAAIVTAKSGSVALSTRSSWRSADFFKR